MDIVAHKAAIQRAMAKCFKLVELKDDFKCTIQMPKEVVQHTHSVDIRKEHLTAWIKRDELDFNFIVIYIRFLIEKFRPSMYKFFCPQCVAYKAKTDSDINKDDRPRYISFAMGESRGQLWIVPYHEDHWMLAVIDPALAIVYWLDPLGCQVSKYFKTLCACVFSNYYSKSLKSKPPMIQFKNIECPKPEEFISCGFFVCRFMRDISQANSAEIPTEYFSPSPKTFTDEQMNEVIEEGVQFIQPYLDLELTVIRS